MLSEAKFADCLSNVRGTIPDHGKVLHSKNKQDNHNPECLYEEDMEYFPRSIHDLDTGKNYIEVKDGVQERSKTQTESESDTWKHYFCSAKGDLIEDVIETMEDNCVPVTEESLITDSNSVKTDTLDTSYDSTTGEFLVHIGDITYPVDIVEFAKGGGIASSCTTKADERSSDISSRSTCGFYLDPENRRCKDISNGSPYFQHTEAGNFEDKFPTLDKHIMLEQSRPTAENTSDESLSEMDNQWFQKMAAGRTWWLQQHPDYSCLHQHGDMDYPQELSEIFKYNCSMFQEDPLVDSLIRNGTDVYNSTNTSPNFYQCASSPVTMVTASYPYVCVKCAPTLNMQRRALQSKCDTKKQLNCDDDKGQREFVGMTDEISGHVIGAKILGDMRHVQGKCQKTATGSSTCATTHPRILTSYSERDILTEDCATNNASCTNSKKTNKQCAPTVGVVKKMKRGCRLWEFIRNLLLDPTTNPTIIRWENRDQGTFKLVQSKAIAHIWGMKKGNEEMNYEKLSRAMRYYYKRQIFAPVLGKRLVYSFGPRATGWRVDER